MNDSVRSEAFVGKACAVLGCLILVGVFAFAVQPACAQAVSNVNVTLEPGKAYSSYDITGDGKADKVKVKPTHYSSGSYKYVDVYVNGERAYRLKTWSGDGSFGVRYLKLKDGTPFLAVVENGVGNEEGAATILKWKSGKLRSVLDCNALGKAAGVGTHLYAKRIKASGNRVVCAYEFNYTSAGIMNCSYGYVYRGGKLKRMSQATSKFGLGVVGSSTRRATASCGIQLYTNAACSKAGGKVRAGDKVTLKRIRMTSNVHAVKVTTASGKSGWFMIKRDGAVNYRLLFNESYNAG